MSKAPSVLNVHMHARAAGVLQTSGWLVGIISIWSLIIRDPGVIAVWPVPPVDSRISAPARNMANNTHVSRSTQCCSIQRTAVVQPDYSTTRLQYNNQTDACLLSQMCIKDNMNHMTLTFCQGPSCTVHHHLDRHLGQKDRRSEIRQEHLQTLQSHQRSRIAILQCWQQNTS